MEAVVSKGEFAALINVSPGRISQYLAEGKISQAALVGSGRAAKINVERARQDLRLTLDVSQRLGNGIDTRLDDGRPPSFGFPSGNTPGAPPLAGGIDHEIKQQKLDDLRRRNRNAAIEDAKAQGRLMETDAARAEMARIASAMLQVFEGALPDLATGLAAQFKLPQRDLLHFLRKQMKQVRANAANQMRVMAVTIPETTQSTLDAHEIETVN